MNIQSKLIGMALLGCIGGGFGIASIGIYQDYLVKKETLRTFKPTTAFVKTGETIKIETRTDKPAGSEPSSSSASRRYKDRITTTTDYSPCIFVKLTGEDTVLKSCQNWSYNQASEAQKVLNTKYGAGQTFTIYVNPQKTEVHLEPYKEGDENWTLAGAIIAGLISLAWFSGVLLLWNYKLPASETD